MLDAARLKSPSFPTRHEARSLATATDALPTSPPLSFNPFASNWDDQAQLSSIQRLQPWHVKPIIVRDSMAISPNVRGHHGLGADPIELHQNLYACLRVGRLDRASFIIDRLSAVYLPSAPELVDAHNVYLQALLETAQQDPKDDSLVQIEKWYDEHMVRKGLEPNAHTFVTLIRAAINFLDESAIEQAVRRYMNMALEHGPGVIEEINASSDFSDEEWDVLIRLQPEAFEEPPSIQEIHELHVSSPVGRRNLIEHGLISHPAQEIKPVPQKGVGLDSLKHALTLFIDPEAAIPYPHDMEGTQDEKDRAHAYARQLRVEQDSVDAAIARWKHENDMMKDVGVHGVLNSKPIKAIMYDWYQALVPLFKKRLEHTSKILAEPIKENLRDGSHGYAPWLESFKPETLAALTIARVITSCVRFKDDENSPIKVSAMSVSIGTDIQDHLRASARTRRDAFLKKQRRMTRKDLIEKLSKTKPDANPNVEEETVAGRSMLGIHKTDIPLIARTTAGAMCIELLLQTAKMNVTVTDPQTGEPITNSIAAFHHSIDYHRGKRIGVIVPHHEVLGKLRNEAVLGVQSVKLPMVMEPKPWSSFQDGGYYTIPQKVLRQKHGDLAQRSYAESAIENGDMDQVLAGLDVLGRVPWQINAPVLEAMTTAWNAGEGLASLVPENFGLERPAELPMDAGFVERTKWTKEMKEYENELSGYHSQRCFQNFQLETAKAFVHEKKIFFPHSIDFRGRAYPIPPVLNHLGSDVARGLLKFANGKELGTVGLRWLKIHLANLYGYDKASLSDREKFAMDHIKDVYDSANDPLGGQRWWSKAEDPWQCLACCIELKNAMESPDPTRFVSQMPVHQDGTCNGLQHYAALGGDHAGARQVNLEPSDRPQDIYTGVAELVREMVNKDADKGDHIALFIKDHITRKVVKRTVMTNVYGVTFIGAKLQVLGELKDAFPDFQDTPEIRSLAHVAIYIAQKIFEALGKIFNGAQDIQYWLGECGDRITTSLTAEQVKKVQARFDGVPGAPYEDKFVPPKKMTRQVIAKMNKNMESFRSSIIWTTPLKMPVVQPYRKDGSLKVSTKVQDITVLRRTNLDAVDKRRQLQAFPPNFIHSLDATHMMLSALKCSEKGLDFAAVHDSFWTHACDIPNLNVILRDAFVRMHSEDIIDRLAAEFAARYDGAMYRPTIRGNTKVAKKINNWRAEERLRTGITNVSSNVRSGSASFAELALESKRQELLQSEDPQERRKGEEMVTPTKIWREHQDPTAIASFRLELLGERGKRAKGRYEESREKVLGAEIEAHETETHEAGTHETDAAESELEHELEADPDAKGTRKRTAAQKIAEKWNIQVWAPLTFPPVPQKGSWDVTRLRESEYFFS